VTRRGRVAAIVSPALPSATSLGCRPAERSPTRSGVAGRIESFRGVLGRRRAAATALDAHLRRRRRRFGFERAPGHNPV